MTDKHPLLTFYRDEVVLTDPSNGRPINSTSLDNYYQAARELYLPLPMGLLRPAVRYVSRHGHFVMLERPPVEVEITYHSGEAVPGAGEANGMNFTLPLPWQVYLMRWNPNDQGGRAPMEMRIFARPGPIQTPDDELFLLPLPNTAANGACCGGQADRLWTQVETRGQAVDQAIGLYWSAFFNDDLGWWSANSVPFGHRFDDGHGNIFQGHSPLRRVQFLQSWAGESLRSIMDWEWRPCLWLNDESTTIAHVMDYADQVDQPDGPESAATSAHYVAALQRMVQTARMIRARRRR